MAYKLTKKLTKVNYTPMSGKVNKYIVIHYTGNKTDTAKNNADYFYGVNRGASATYFVDDDTVYQVVEDKDKAWHCGKNYGNNNLFGKVTNANSIGIEMCSKNGKITDATYKNVVELVRQLMKKYGIPADNVVRHWDVCSKICPGWNGWGANGCDASIWKQFKKDIQASSTEKPKEPSKDTTPKVTKVSGTITVTYKGKDGVEVHTTPDFNASSCDKKAGPVGPGTKKGSVFTVVGKVKVGTSYMYKLKSGLYITASAKYVSFKKN